MTPGSKSGAGGGDAGSPAACPAPNHTPTISSYRKGCRCPETVRVQRASWRQRWQRRPKGQTPHTAPRPRDPVVDEIAVDRACRGDWVPLTPAERRAASLRLTAWGWSAVQIARQLRITSRTVQRYRDAVRLSTDCAEARQHDRFAALGDTSSVVRTTPQPKARRPEAEAA